MSKTEKTKVQSPSLIAYHVKEAGDQSYWTRIGVAFSHKDGEGFNLILDSLPFDGKVTVRTVAENKSDSE